MKKISILFLFISLVVCGQSHEIAVKVHLEDAYTGKNIKNAKVTLEGFEIPQIVGKYDKKGKFYYFNEVPKGYNTLMAYHEKYNEKGFQNVHGLPKELKLNLCEPLNVTYGFLKVPDSIYNDRKKKREKNKKYRDYYIEDPFKIAVSVNENLNYEELKEFLKKHIKEYRLEIELVNPSWERDRIDDRPYNTLQKEGYPKIEANESDELTGEFVFPLLSGLNNVQAMFDSNYSKSSKDICFFFRKKNGSRFKRFNDPIIKKLKERNLIVYSVILNKKGEYESAKLFSKSDFKAKDNLNKEFKISHNIDSSRVFFYDNNIYKLKKKSTFLNFFRKKQAYMQFDEPILDKKAPSFILIDNDDVKISNCFFCIEDDFKEQSKIPIQQKSIGLGILDMYEYYFKEN